VKPVDLPLSPLNPISEILVGVFKDYLDVPGNVVWDILTEIGKFELSIGFTF